MHLLVTRPEPDASVLADTLKARGHEVTIAPLMQIVTRDFSVDLDGVQGVLFTSANGVRAYADRIGTPPADLAAHAVGPACAEAARDAGWNHVSVAGGDVHALTALVAAQVDPKAGQLVHVSGKAAAGDLAGGLAAQGFDVQRVIGYGAKTPDILPDEVVRVLEAGVLDGVLLFSPRSAAIYADLAKKGGLAVNAGAVTAYCLSPAVAEALKAQISAPCVVATAPETPHLLALLSP